MKIQEVEADLHSHIVGEHRSSPGEFVLKILGDHRDQDLKEVSERGFRREKHTLLSITSFGNDTIYEKIVNTRGNIPVSCLYDDFKETFIGVHNPERNLWSFVVRSQEIPSDKGHVLIHGGNRNIESRVFTDILDQAEDMGALKISDHPLGKNSWIANLLNRLINGQTAQYSLGKENLVEYANRLDAMEIGNSNYFNLFEETKSLALDLGIPGVCNSDAHSKDCAFSSYNSFNELDFTDNDSLNQSMRDSLNSGDYKTHPGKNRVGEHYLHGSVMVYNKLRRVLGLLNQEPKRTIV